jgi:hypothetical protein
MRAVYKSKFASLSPFLILYSKYLLSSRSSPKLIALEVLPISNLRYDINSPPYRVPVNRTNLSISKMCEKTYIKYACECIGRRVDGNNANG